MNETVERGAAERSARGSTNTSYCEDEHTDHSESDHDDDKMKGHGYVNFIKKEDLKFQSQVLAAPAVGPVKLPPRQRRDMLPQSVFTIPSELDMSLMLEFSGGSYNPSCQALYPEKDGAEPKLQGWDVGSALWTCAASSEREATEETNYCKKL
ncbi:hypothetical protein E1301_Tti001395 [Triplophysa tibetana]|uniref:Uncharacterized protein n=1 Tax=Triplophysa tibetana TaxID=1572043 RepID=A0A5A9PA24_9TELE|nr:hypothetical protein E1301_Tti001395 [Triplophysa tibetana]